MAAKRIILYFTVDSEIRTRFKAAAALRRKSLRAWAIEAMEEKVERELPGPLGTAVVQDKSDRGALEQAIHLAESLYPRISVGSKGEMDAAKDLGTMRNDRAKAFGY